MGILQFYQRVQDDFERVLTAVPDDAWSRPSMCPGWTARDIAGHIVWGLRQTRHIALGTEFEYETGAPGSTGPRRRLVTTRSAVGGAPGPRCSTR
ncbi:maleylpyruvate isomerase N-terminal domain-containing protein [Saccharothrix sp.]|uniref:maleylpyruvate isomerase N-terminal domain-containing protein n=1 Tax=Saccharothrix sp. TaxID=1873460 RepID=UPI0035C82308